MILRILSCLLPHSGDVDRLAHPEWEVRREAHARLADAGRLAYPALLAADTRDPERRLRVRALLGFRLSPAVTDRVIAYRLLTHPGCTFIPVSYGEHLMARPGLPEALSDCAVFLGVPADRFALARDFPPGLASPLSYAATVGHLRYIIRAKGHGVWSPGDPVGVDTAAELPRQLEAHGDGANAGTWPAPGPLEHWAGLFPPR